MNEEEDIGKYHNGMDTSKGKIIELSEKNFILRVNCSFSDIYTLFILK